MKPIIWMMLIVLVSCGNDGPELTWRDRMTVNQMQYFSALSVVEKAYFESCIGDFHNPSSAFAYCMRNTRDEFGAKPPTLPPERPSGPRQVAGGPTAMDIAVGTAVGGVAAKAASKLLFD